MASVFTIWYFIIRLLFNVAVNLILFRLFKVFFINICIRIDDTVLKIIVFMCVMCVVVCTMVPGVPALFL